MVRKLFKKSIACLIAVLMVVTSLPFTAITAMAAEEDYTFSAPSPKGTIVSGSNSRIDNGSFNIVNDRQDDNFSIGFWSFDVVGIGMKDATVNQATFNVQVTSDKDQDYQGLTFYYVGNGNADTLNEGSQKISSIFGENGAHADKAKTYYGLTQIAQFGDVTNGQILSINVAPALNATLNKALDKLTIMVMQTNPGQEAGNNGWTDVKLSGNATITNCKIDVPETNTDPGLTGLRKAIEAYEAKMAKVGTDGVVYKNMAPAYQAYIEAVRFADAYEYGKNNDAYLRLEAKRTALTNATSAMTTWSDSVTGRYTSDGNSQIPSFTDTSTSDMQNFKDMYGNILYTEKCESNYNGTNDGSNQAGQAIEFPSAASTIVRIYYPNTVLLYDGKDAIMPVAFAGKRNTSSNRYIYTVYPAVSGATNSYKDSFPGNNAEFQSLYLTKGDDGYNWKGKDGANTLDWDYARGQSNIVGSSSNNPAGHWSQVLGRAWGNGYWNTYATSFQVTNNIDFKGEGYKDLNPYWAWYGGSTANANDAKGIDGSLKGYAQSVSKKIYVLNYKMLADAIKKNDYLTRLKSVSEYTEGGLLSVLQAYDEATVFTVSDTNLSNVVSKGNKIKELANGIAANVEADSNDNDYAALKTAILKARRVYDNGNENNENYTAESWAPFKTAYDNAVNYFYQLQNRDIVTADATQYIAPLENAQKALVLNREVVDSTTLEYAIDNALALIRNSQYFVSGSVNSLVLQELVDAAKVAVWQSVDGYGLDSEKILKTSANQTIVENHLAAITAEVAKAVIDTNSLVVTYNRSMNTAIADGEALAPNKDQYANYASVQTAINNAKNFKANLPTINARIEGQVTNVINQYINYTDAIGFSIFALRKSFMLTENGTVANAGQRKTIEIRAARRPNQFRFFFKYPSNVVYFKTERDPMTLKLPNVTWETYNAQTGNNFDTVLDSINLNAQDVPTSELTSATAAGIGANSTGAYALSEAQIQEHPGSLSITNNNLGLTLNNFKVKSSTGQAVGVDAAGNNITDMSYDFTDLLAETQGTKPRAGGIYALNGTTYIDCDANISVPATTGAPTAANKTSVKSMQMDLHAAGTEIGVLYFWRYAETALVNWAGYSFEKAPIDLKVGIVDLCTLFDLIETMEDEEFLATANQYTTSSWNALESAISHAKANMDTDNMSYDEIVDECDARYDALFAARQNLVLCASNAKLKEAVNAAKNVYANDESKVDPATWTAFRDAYEAAAAKYQGDYSDTGVRDFAKTEQTKIDAVATALINAMNALAYQIDFTPIDTAVATLVQGVETKKYTAASVREFIEAINDLTYFNMALSERASHYTSETAVVNGVNAELANIPTLKNILVEGDLDVDALEAAKALGKTTLADPDAYNQDEINANLAALSAYEDVNIIGEKTVSCFKYDDQKDLDADVSAALSGISIQQYYVKVNGSLYGEGYYDYGTEITVSSTEGIVDWFYASASTTSTTAEKYYSTGDEVTFVVKGDTELRATKNDTASNQVKVTYVNGVNSRIESVEYVEAGSTITLEEAVAPKLVYYAFSGFKANGSILSAGDTLKVDEDTVITIVYDFTNADSYYVYVADLNYGYGDCNFIVENLKYNDNLSFQKGTEANGYADGYYDADVNYYLNGEKIDAGADTGRYQEADVYAWVQVGADDLEDWMNNATAGLVIDRLSGGDLFSEYAINNTHGKVVAYGTDYTFRIHENVVLFPLDKDTYDLAVAQGVVEDPGDANGAKITTNSKLMIAEGVKFSIVSTFTLPDDCTMVETGLLFVANKNSSTTPSATLSLGTAGTNGVARIKSTAHTAGNQFVVSVGSTKLAGKTVGQVGMKWAAYMTYRDKDGNSVTVYSDPTTPSNTSDNF